MQFDRGGWRADAARAAAVVALLAALSGCTGDVQPIVTETPEVAGTSVAAGTPTPSPSPSPSDAPLTNEELWALMPENAERTDLVGAMVTAKFFLEQYAPMFHTGDTRIWEALSGDECGYCADVLNDSSDLRRDGWTAEGGDIAIDSPTVRARMTGESSAYYSAEVDRATAYLTPDGGAQDVAAEAHRAEFKVELVNVSGRWLINGVASETVDTK